MIRASTRVFAVLGDPVEHSRSPEIQNAALRESGLDGVYIALRCGEPEMEGFLRGLARAGGGGNVTLPHKERAARTVEHPSEAVRRTGACNTFWGDEEGRVHGDNTDVEGFARAVRRLLGKSPEGARVLLLGAGGAARAALTALVDGGAEEVGIHNRSVDRARAVSRRIGGSRSRVVENEREWVDESYDLVVNATSLGLEEGDPLPIDLDRLGRVGALLDLVYGPDETPLVRAARERSIRAADGGEMLVQQGAVAFERWWSREAPVEAMRGALRPGGEPG